MSVAVYNVLYIQSLYNTATNISNFSLIPRKMCVSLAIKVISEIDDVSGPTFIEKTCG